jgi:hypothetical protein
MKSSIVAIAMGLGLATTAAVVKLNPNTIHGPDAGVQHTLPDGGAHPWILPDGGLNLRRHYNRGPG